MLKSAIAPPLGFKRSCSPADLLAGSSKYENLHVAVINKGKLSKLFQLLICSNSKILS